MTEEPAVGVDVVIAVHDVTRPIARAVRSVLDHNGQGVRLTVVCHEVPVPEIAAKLPDAHRDQVRFLAHTDGRRSPAGPFNAGLEAAEAEFVAVMGSDDTLAPGAVASWFWLARKHNADAVIARLEHDDGRVVPTPPTRPQRRGVLDPVRDRLSYRSAPLGLVSRAAIARLGLRMDQVAVGEDVGFTTRLWFGGRVVLDRSGPAYRIGGDAIDRVTFTTRPIVDELEFVRRLVRRTWFAALGLVERRAVCVKIARIHLFGAVLNRPDPDWWTPEQRADLASVARAVLDAAPGMTAVLSRADRALLDKILNGSGSAEELLSLARARRRHGHPSTLLTSDPWHLLAREAPLRLMAASVLMR
ncbi:glycosyltransferase [Pseudactinotalea sp.]|uniref:glycosyltransferase n=1 Tax=Pseudactinotalea sp. TaxID=1926260 RepID=UPI003B3A8E5A